MLFRDEILERLQVLYRQEELAEGKIAIEVATRGEVSNRMATEVLQLSLDIKSSRPLEIRRQVSPSVSEFDNPSWKRLS